MLNNEPLRSSVFQCWLLFFVKNLHRSSLQFKFSTNRHSQLRISYNLYIQARKKSQLNFTRKKITVLRKTSICLEPLKPHMDTEELYVADAETFLRSKLRRLDDRDIPLKSRYIIYRIVFIST